MKYKLYLDDVRYPDLHPDWRIARNFHDARWMVKSYGVPYHISFDHDLADVHYEQPDYGHNDDPMVFIRVPYEFTGYDFAKWFCYYVLDNDVNLPFDFTYDVHSMNPVGAENIKSFMDNFMRDGYI